MTKQLTLEDVRLLIQHVDEALLAGPKPRIFVINEEALDRDIRKSLWLAGVRPEDEIYIVNKLTDTPRRFYLKPRK